MEESSTLEQAQSHEVTVRSGTSDHQQDALGHELAVTTQELLGSEEGQQYEQLRPEASQEFTIDADGEVQVSLQQQPEVVKDSPKAVIEVVNVERSQEAIIIDTTAQAITPVLKESPSPTRKNFFVANRGDVKSQVRENRLRASQQYANARINRNRSSQRTNDDLRDFLIQPTSVKAGIQRKRSNNNRVTVNETQQVVSNSGGVGGPNGWVPYQGIVGKSIAASTQGKFAVKNQKSPKCHEVSLKIQPERASALNDSQTEHNKSPQHSPSLRDGKRKLKLVLQGTRADSTQTHRLKTDERQKEHPNQESNLSQVLHSTLRQTAPGFDAEQAVQGAKVSKFAAAESSLTRDHESVVKAGEVSELSKTQTQIRRPQIPMIETGNLNQAAPTESANQTPRLASQATPREETRDANLSVMSALTPISPVSSGSPTNPRRKQVYSRNSNTMTATGGARAIHANTVTSQFNFSSTLGSVAEDQQAARKITTTQGGNRLIADNDAAVNTQDGGNSTPVPSSGLKKKHHQEQPALLDLNPAIHMFQRQGQDSVVTASQYEDGPTPAEMNKDLELAIEQQLEQMIDEQSITSINRVASGGQQDSLFNAASHQRSINRHQLSIGSSQQTKAHYVSIECQLKEKPANKQLKPKHVPKFQFKQPPIGQAFNGLKKAPFTAGTNPNPRHIQQGYNNRRLGAKATRKVDTKPPASSPRSQDSYTLASPTSSSSVIGLNTRTKEILHKFQSLTSPQANDRDTQEADFQLSKMKKSFSRTPRAGLNTGSRHLNMLKAQTQGLSLASPRRSVLEPESTYDTMSQIEGESYPTSMTTRGNATLPPMAFTGLLRAAPNTQINQFARKKRFQVCKGTFLTQEKRHSQVGNVEKLMLEKGGAQFGSKRYSLPPKSDWMTQPARGGTAQTEIPQSQQYSQLNSQDTFAPSAGGSRNEDGFNSAFDHRVNIVQSQHGPRRPQLEAVKQLSRFEERLRKQHDSGAQRYYQFESKMTATKAADGQQKLLLMKERRNRVNQVQPKRKLKVQSGEIDISIRGVIKPRGTMLQNLSVLPATVPSSFDLALTTMGFDLSFDPQKTQPASGQYDLVSPRGFNQSIALAPVLIDSGANTNFSGIHTINGTPSHGQGTAQNSPWIQQTQQSYGQLTDRAHPSNQPSPSPVKHYTNLEINQFQLQHERVAVQIRHEANNNTQPQSTLSGSQYDTTNTFVSRLAIPKLPIGLSEMPMLYQTTSTVGKADEQAVSSNDGGCKGAETQRLSRLMTERISKNEDFGGHNHLNLTNVQTVAQPSPQEQQVRAEVELRERDDYSNDSESEHERFSPESKNIAAAASGARDTFDTVSEGDTNRGQVKQLSIAVVKSDKEGLNIVTQQTTAGRQSICKVSPTIVKQRNYVKEDDSHLEQRQNATSPVFSPRLKGDKLDPRTGTASASKLNALSPPTSDKSASGSPIEHKNEQKKALLSFEKHRYEPCFAKIKEVNKMQRKPVGQVSLKSSEGVKGSSPQDEHADSNGDKKHSSLLTVKEGPRQDSPSQMIKIMSENVVQPLDHLHQDTQVSKQFSSFGPTQDEPATALNRPPATSERQAYGNDKGRKKSDSRWSQREDEERMAPTPQSEYKVKHD